MNNKEAYKKVKEKEKLIREEQYEYSRKKREELYKFCIENSGHFWDYAGGDGWERTLEKRVIGYVRIKRRRCLACKYTESEILEVLES